MQTNPQNIKGGKWGLHGGPCRVCGKPCGDRREVGAIPRKIRRYERKREFAAIHCEALEPAAKRG